MVAGLRGNASMFTEYPEEVPVAQVLQNTETFNNETLRIKLRWHPSNCLRIDDCRGCKRHRLHFSWSPVHHIFRGNCNGGIWRNLEQFVYEYIVYRLPNYRSRPVYPQLRVC